MHYVSVVSLPSNTFVRPPCCYCRSQEIKGRGVCEVLQQHYVLTKFRKNQSHCPTDEMGDTSRPVLKEISHSKKDKLIKGAGNRLKRGKFPDEYRLSSLDQFNRPDCIHTFLYLCFALSIPKDQVL